MVEAIPTVEPSIEDTFAAAFAEISAEEKRVDTKGDIVTDGLRSVQEEDQARVNAAAEKAAPVVAAVEPAAKPGEIVETKSTEIVAAEAAAAAAAEAAAQTLRETTAKAEEDLLRRLAVATKTVREPEVREQVETRQAVEPPPPAFTAEQIAALNAYEKDFPEVAAAERLIRHHEYKQLIDHVMQQVARNVMPVLTPLAERVQVLSERTHLGDITREAPDYSAAMRQKIIDWVGTQPEYLQRAYGHVIQQGSEPEVIDLINRFKSATGYVTTSTNGVTPASKPTVTELPAAAKKAAAALAPVSSKRSSVVTGTDPSDFDGAFAEAAKSLN